MSKHTKYEHQGLSDLVGTALSKKLLADANKSVEDLYQVLTGDIATAGKNRMGLAEDELNHLPADKKEDALHIVRAHFRKYLQCEVMKLAAKLSLLEGDTMSEYIGHAAAHYEYLVQDAVVTSIEHVLDKRDSENLNDAAKAATGSDN